MIPTQQDPEALSFLKNRTEYKILVKKTRPLHFLSAESGSIVLEHVPAADHGADHTLARDDIFADRYIDVDDDETDDDPHATVMPQAYILTLSDQGNQPAEPLILPAAQTRGRSRSKLHGSE